MVLTYQDAHAYAIESIHLTMTVIESDVVHDSCSGYKVGKGRREFTFCVRQQSHVCT